MVIEVVLGRGRDFQVTKHQCRTCNFRHSFLKYKIGRDGESELTSKQVDVCIKRNYTLCSGHFKLQDCRLWKFREDQTTLEKRTN